MKELLKKKKDELNYPKSKGLHSQKAKQKFKTCVLILLLFGGLVLAICYSIAQRLRVFMWKTHKIKSNSLRDNV